MATGTRYRAQLDASSYELVPPSARDLESAGRVHWLAVDAGPEDPVLQGATWALAWSLRTVFGQSVGDVLLEATLSNVERWNGSQWVPVA